MESEVEIHLYTTDKGGDRVMMLWKDCCKVGISQKTVEGAIGDMEMLLDVE